MSLKLEFLIDLGFLKC